jgi:hypothetical protein
MAAVPDTSMDRELYSPHLMGVPGFGAHITPEAKLDVRLVGNCRPRDQHIET